jgi:ribokinase
MKAAGSTGVVVVVGSANVDHVVRVARLPRPGETVLGTGYAMHLGGKGANQAVAAARMGAEVVFVGAVGRDASGHLSLKALVDEGIDAHNVARTEEPTGAAVITVDEDGENQIAVAPGANGLVDPAAIAEAVRAANPAVVVAVLEIPMASVIAAAVAAAGTGAQVLLDPAPPVQLPDDLLATHPVLTPNSVELAIAAGDRAGASVRRSARRLLERGASALLITRGAGGVLAITPTGEVDIPGERAGAVRDATGAGDTFLGALAALLAGGEELLTAARIANAAAGLSVLREGARGGMPTRDKLAAYLARSG